MQGAFLSGTPLRLALCVALLATPAPGAAQAPSGGTAQVSVEVPEGKTKSIRLRNLPRGTALAVRVDADGALVVALVSAVQLQSSSPEALFKAALDRRISFKVTIPDPGHYYLVLDNRAGSEAVKARATVQVGARPKRPEAPPGKVDET